MGVDYRQYCMIGVSFDWSELKIITTPAEYKLENRYDTKTGKVTHQEEILVKEEKFHYELCDRTFKCVEDIRLDGLYAEIDYDNKCLYIGIFIGEPVDFGNVVMLEDSLDVSELIKTQDKVEAILPQYSKYVKLHFFNSVG